MVYSFRKNLAALTLAAIACAPLVAQDSKPASEPASNAAGAEETAVDVFQPASELESISYILGAQTGDSFRINGIEVDFGAFLRGMQDSIEEAEQPYDAAEKSEIMREWQREVRKRQMAKREVAAGENLEKAEAFLEENKDGEGVVTTDSGLQYTVLEDAEGDPPASTDSVKVHYRGTLLDGTEFDNSYKRGTPAEFGVSGVIKGWTEALQLMAPGAKYKLWIHPDLAYGEQGRPSIPPNSLLVFEVELLEIK